MALPQDIIDDMMRGKAFLSDRNVEHLAELRSGCVDCKNDNVCLMRILRGLDYKAELDEFDYVTEKLHHDLIIIIGDYTVLTRPQVSAGIDKTVEVGNPVTFTAIVIPGSAVITSILWTQVFGPSEATLAGTNTAVLSVSNVEAGDYIFKVEVTDANGQKANDQTILIAYASSSSGSNIFTTPRNKYSSADRVDDYSIIITELIGADTSETGFFNAHRGTGTVLGGSSLPPDDNNVQVDSTTGRVTFLYPFSDDQVERLWFDYKLGGGTPDPPDPSGNPLLFSPVFSPLFQ